MKHQINLYYGYEETGQGIYHSFEAVAPDAEIDEDAMRAKLVEALDVEDESRFDYDCMHINLPDSVVERIKAEGVSEYLRSSSRFDVLCQDFDKRRPKGPVVRRTPWFNTTWDDKSLSVNDMLRRFLREHNYEYINSMNGDVWFLYHGNWRCCDHEVTGDAVQFYMREFIDN